MADIRPSALSALTWPRIWFRSRMVSPTWSRTSARSPPTSRWISMAWAIQPKSSLSVRSATSSRDSPRSRPIRVSLTTRLSSSAMGPRFPGPQHQSTAGGCARPAGRRRTSAGCPAPVHRISAAAGRPADSGTRRSPTGSEDQQHRRRSRAAQEETRDAGHEGDGAGHEQVVAGLLLEAGARPACPG